MVQGPIGPDDVKELRRRLGLTQRELAGVLNVMPYVGSNWETGKHRPTGTAAGVMSRLLSEGGDPSGGDAARDEAVVLGELPIRQLVETLRWIDERDASGADHVDRLRALLDDVRAEVCDIVGTDMEPEDANAAGVAISMVQHCMKLLDEH